MAVSKLRILLLNTSVLFLIETDIVLSNDDLRDAVDCDIRECYETVSEIKTVLLTVERHRK
jgi:transcriptional antiterminator